MNTTKNIVKEQSNIICMCQHTAKQTIYLEIFQNKMKSKINLYEDIEFRRKKRIRTIWDFDSAKRKMVKLFCQIYFWNENCRSRCEYIGWYMKQTIFVKSKENKDYIFNLNDIFTALYCDISSEMLFERYKNNEYLMNNWHEEQSLKSFYLSYFEN